MVAPFTIRCITCGKEVTRGCVIDMGQDDYCDECNPYRQFIKPLEKDVTDEIRGPHPHIE